MEALSSTTKRAFARFCTSPTLCIFSLFLLSNNYFAQQAISSRKSTNNFQPACLPDRQAIDRSLRFTPNMGQIADKDGKPYPDILYKGEGNGTDIYLRKTGISYMYTNMGEVMHEVDKQVEELISVQPGNTPDPDKQKIKDELLQKKNIKIHRVDMDFADCNSNMTTTNENELDGYQNFYYSHCPNGILNVKQYNKVTYKNIYNGIDIVYSGGTEKGIKYDLIVQPYADPNQIKLHWKGTESIHINHEGNLVIKTSLSEFTESIPKVYQLINGKVIDVRAKYILKGTTVNFELGTWNPSYPLVVDPWATYYGGTGDDYGYSTACDNTGNVYMSGYTNSNNIIATAGGFQTVWGGGSNWGGYSDAFLVKFNSITGARIWATYYGGTGDDYGYSTACDNFGNVYMAGYTNSPNAIATATGHQPVLSGNYDAFLVKFNSAAGTRTWATYYGSAGGLGNELGYSAACDNTGNVYLTGSTTSTNAGNAIATATGHQTVFGGGADAFLVKFYSTGVRDWATYYGDTRNQIGHSVACDITGNVYLAGYTDRPDAVNGNVIATPGAHQTVFGGGTDAFLVKFNSATGIRNWGTYYGGGADDRAYSAACDNTGNVYLAGWTNSANTGNGMAIAPGYQTVFGGGNYDAFLVQFNSTTGVRNWGTYYGSNLSEVAWWGCLAIDGNKNVYLYMEVEDAPGPNLIDACAYQPNFAGGIEDQMIVKFSSTGKKLCATYFGGTGYEDLDLGGGIAISGNLLFICASNGVGAGTTVAGGYPVTTGAHQTIHSGGRYDAVLACLCINICESKTSLGLGFVASTSICANTPVTFTPIVANSCDTTDYKYHWVFTGGTPAVSDSVSPTVKFSGAGSHDVKLVVTTLCKKDSLTKINYITVNPCGGCTLNAQYTKGTANCSNCGCKEWIMVNATGGTSPYTYTWPDGYDKRYKNALCPGIYNVIVTDNNGCKTTVKVNAP